jgi:hypothetical protein
MRWGKVAVLLFTGVVGLGLGLVVAEPWDAPTRVDALELDDEAWREDDASDGEVRDDDGDDDDGTRTNGGGGNAAAATDDGRDGTRDGDTSHGRGTGTGVDNSDAAVAGGGTDDGGGFSPGANSATGGGGASGGGTT